MVSDQALAGLREALTSHQIDAVRITLAGDQQIEKSVNDKNGKRMMEKFSCFYQSLDKKGIVLSIADPTGRPAQSPPSNDSGKLSDSAASLPSQELKSVVGAWVMQSDQSNQLQLNPDGSFLLHQLGRDYQGRFTVEGGKIFIQPE